MAKQEYTDYQKNAISNYYKNVDTLMLGKLSELVSELFLEESEAKEKGSGKELKKRWLI